MDHQDPIHSPGPSDPSGAEQDEDSCGSITGDEKDLPGHVCPLDHDGKDAFESESTDWYTQDFMQRAAEHEEMIDHPVQGCPKSGALAAFHAGCDEFDDLSPAELEQLNGAGGNFVRTKKPRFEPATMELVYQPDYSLPLEQRMLDMLDFMNPGFKENLAWAWHAVGSLVSILYPMVSTCLGL